MRILDCPRCKTPATQEHFLDTCPVNAVPRMILLSSIPSYVAVEQLGLRKLSVFYREVRGLTVTLAGGLGTERDVLEGIYANLALAASSLAAQFASNALSLLKRRTERTWRRMKGSWSASTRSAVT